MPDASDSLILPNETTPNAQKISTHSISSKIVNFEVSRDSESKKQRHESSTKIEDTKPKKLKLTAIGDSNLRDCDSRLNTI